MKRIHRSLVMAAALAAAIIGLVALLLWILANTPAPFNNCPCHL